MSAFLRAPSARVGFARGMARGRYEDAVWEVVSDTAREAPGISVRRAFLREQLAAAGGSRVLDVGCGEAQLAAELALAGARVVGIDLSAEALRRARAHTRGLDLRLITDPERWPLADASFDLVWAGETIEHVLDTARWLSEARRVLRPGGRLALTTPAHGRVTLLGLALRGRSYDRHFDPRSDHLRFYSARTLRRLLADFRFEDIDLRRAGRLPGARRLLLASARRARF